ncbi:hypothetical protein EDB19DRAFT_200654 [Suillus lakei]|nr:hypothetical protein EDB19DRAFT_200654 [Suillus lakei]
MKTSILILETSFACPVQEGNLRHKTTLNLIKKSGLSSTFPRIQHPKLNNLSLLPAENFELRPTTDEISRIYPRFRILVIGKNGVGKSSLINHIFGVQNALASHNTLGVHSIDDELHLTAEREIVLHDSNGFEPGKEDNLKIVRDFIDRRREMPYLMKDQLHAIWLCFEIPFADGRLLETDTETFLTWKREGKLGNIPIVVVFTKYDKLLDRMERTLDESVFESLSEDAIEELVKKNAQYKLHDVCIAPLEKISGPDIPHVTVSTNGNHEETLAHLIQITEERVRKHVGLEASVTLMNAQRVDPRFKIMASIEVGKRRYRKALTSSISFKNRTMRDCLNMLHTDIVAVWNFHDPHRHLCSPEFRTLIVNIVEWSDSRTVLQRFMSYLVDLILILQMLDLVSVCQDVTRRAIKLVVASYLASSVSGEVHTRIQEYDRGLTFLERADRDTLDKIAEVITIYSFDAKQMSALRSGIHTAYFSLDEPWEV